MLRKRRKRRNLLDKVLSFDFANPAHRISLLQKLIIAFGIVFMIHITCSQHTYMQDFDIFEKMTSIPTRVAVDAIKNGGIRALLFGTDEERHRFAKGLPTQFGSMPYDTEAYLENVKGWSTEKVHKVGSDWTFSDDDPYN